MSHERKGVLAQNHLVNMWANPLHCLTLQEIKNRNNYVRLLERVLKKANPVVLSQLKWLKAKDLLYTYKLASNRRIVRYGLTDTGEHVLYISKKYQKVVRELEIEYAERCNHAKTK